MGKFVDVEVTVTSTVVYRLPRPTKAEVVEMMGDDAWDKDDPESSIQEFIESQGIEDMIKGFRPVSVDVDDMEIVCVDPAGKGAKPLEARPKFKLRCQLQTRDGNWHDSWFFESSWKKVGDDFFGEPFTAEQLQSVASKFTKTDAKRLREGRQWDQEPKLRELELVPV